MKRLSLPRLLFGLATIAQNISLLAMVFSTFALWALLISQTSTLNGLQHLKDHTIVDSAGYSQTIRSSVDLVSQIFVRWLIIVLITTAVLTFVSIRQKRPLRFLWTTAALVLTCTILVTFSQTMMRNFIMTVAS